ncbi:MAG: Holliday junction branch migration DNA helicase RuvB [Clostridia bacterium]|nr:Holliday junction branch migration DNA helicase RuvB [Clostridia bacterium]
MAEPERVLSPAQGEDEAALERSLRPRSLAEFPGQAQVKAQLSVFIEAARRRREALDHLLLSGPPGLGKTTLAHIVAAELGASIRVTSGPAIERAGDLAAILTSLGEGDVLFVDEIHRLHPAVAEVLYPAMEDGALDIVIGRGPGAKTLRLSLPRFTLIGATTRPGSLAGPLRDRFGVFAHLDYYRTEELETILARSAEVLAIDLDPGGRREIARRARGTPRVANRLLRRIRDFAEVRGAGRVTETVAREALALLEIDELGLDPVDRRFLRAVATVYGGGPVGLEAVAAAIGEEAATLEDVYEPYLVQIGFVLRTGRGRVLSEAAFRHLGLPVAPGRPGGVAGGRDAAGAEGQVGLFPPGSREP